MSSVSMKIHLFKLQFWDHITGKFFSTKEKRSKDVRLKSKFAGPIYTYKVTYAERGKIMYWNIYKLRHTFIVYGKTIFQHTFSTYWEKNYFYIHLIVL